MNKSQKFQKKEIITLLIWIVLGLIGLFFSLKYYDQTFPQAALDLKITKTEASKIAFEMLTSQKIDLTGYSSSIYFSTSKTDIIYLERTIGLEAANKLMKDKVSVWWWSCRWFKPLQKEEFRVNISPSGKIVDYSHEMEEKAKGENLSKEAAQKIAEEFLKNNLPLPISKYELVQSSKNKRLNRTDHYFTWEEKDFKIGEATYRYNVAIKGDRIAEFSEYLKIPETWERDYRKYEKKGELLVEIFNVFYTFIGVSIFIVFLFKIREKKLNFKFGIIIGLILIFVILLTGINSIPLLWSEFSTTDTAGSFMINLIVKLFLSAIMAGGGIIIFSTTSESVSSDVWKTHQPLMSVFSKAGLVRKEFITACVIGYSLAFLQTIYVTGFYLYGKKIGVWTPPEVPYSNMLSTMVPWIYPFFIGLSAALTEEITFRLFSISILKKYLKFTWLAVLIPAIIWAFLHSNYPQRPFYIRGIELSIVGIVLGYVFVKYGIVATIISHYVYNALMSGELLLRSSNMYYFLSGLAVIGIMLIPLTIAAYFIITGKRSRILEESEKIEIELQQKPVVLEENKQEQIVEMTQLPYEALSKPKRVKLAILSGVCLVGCILTFIYSKSDYFSEDMKITRVDSIGIAENYLRSIKVNTEKFIKVTSYTNHDYSSKTKYIAERVGAKKTKDIFKKEFLEDEWEVIYFKELEKETYYVDIDNYGNVYSYDHKIEDDFKGEKLTTEEAEKKAIEYLKKAKNIDINKYKLVNSYATKRKNRVDHAFTWEQKDFKIGDATLRINLSVKGNEVLGFYKFIKIPEDWVQKEEKKTIRTSIVDAIEKIFFISVFIVCVILFVIKFIKKEFKWKLAIFIGFIFLILEIIGKINNLSILYLNYSNTDKLIFFYVKEAISFILSVAGISFGTTLFVAFADSLYREQFPQHIALEDWSRIKLKSDQWYDAALLTILIMPIIFIFVWCMEWFQENYNSNVFYSSSSLINDSISTFLPAFDTIKNIVQISVFGLIGFILIASLCKKYFKNIKTTIFVLFALTAVFSLKTSSLRQYSWQVADFMLEVLFFLWIAFKYLRFNASAYLLLIFGISVMATCDMLTYSNTFYLINGALILAVGVLPILYLLYIGRFRER